MAGAVRWLEAESLEGATHEVVRPARQQEGMCQVEQATRIPAAQESEPP